MVNSPLKVWMSGEKGRGRLRAGDPWEVRYPGGSPSLREYLQVDSDDDGQLCNVGTLWRVMILGPQLP